MYACLNLRGGESLEIPLSEIQFFAFYNSYLQNNYKLSWDILKINSL